MEGKGLEPTVEALFGANGFFPDIVMKTIYYAADKMPSQVNEVLKTMIPALNDRKKRQVCQTQLTVSALGQDQILLLYVILRLLLLLYLLVCWGHFQI